MLFRRFHHEFWPAWLLYLPLLPWFIYLGIRFGFTSFTACNPAMPASGFVGESKSQILSGINHKSVLRFRLLSGKNRLADLSEWMQQEELTYPIVLKPDAGQRGFGVSVVHSEQEASSYLDEVTVPVIAQEYDFGPHELGIFYLRVPTQRGFVFSVTEKKFPFVMGDGHSTLRKLIVSHSRYKIQKNIFFSRFSDKLDTVIPEGEKVVLSHAGSHSQGCMFLDGRRFNTPELTRTIEEIASTYEGFFFGRFDIRYRSEKLVRLGKGLRVVEVNGVTSESTNMYDPSWNVFRAWITLARQWWYAFGIGKMNIEDGARRYSFVEVWKMLKDYNKKHVERFADG